MKSTIGRAILQIIACANPAAAVTCPAAAAGLTLASGGTLKQAILAAAISFAQIAPGGIWDTVGSIVASSQTGIFGTIATHSIVGGALSVAQGGSFESGALSAGISAGVGGIAGGLGLGDLGNPNTLIARTAIAAITGGTVSRLTGGKFANGAITAAMALLYNEAGHHGSRGTQSGSAPGNCDRNPAYCGGAAGDPMYDAASAAYSALSPTAGATECWQDGCGTGGWAFAAASMIPSVKGAGGAFYLTDKMSDKAFTRLVKDIGENGLIDNVINYVQVGGSNFVVLGNNRLSAARHLGITDQLVFKEVNLPFRGYKSVDDLVPVTPPRYRGR